MTTVEKMTTKRTTAKSKKVTTKPTKSQYNADEIQSMIALAAYKKAEARGFFSGGEIGDWLEAEKEIQEQILN